MKFIKKISIAAFAALCFTACSEDDLSNTSIFEEEMATEETDLDRWINENFTKPYNIGVNYKFVDNEIEMFFNVEPAKPEAAKVLLYYINHVWVGAYNELMGEEFLKQNSPRMLQLVGSSEYNFDGSETLGIAEGGVKITITNANIAEPDAYRSMYYWEKINKYCFHVMFHEYGHILNQKKDYPRDFELVSVADYRATDWVNLTDARAAQLGFISSYASKEPGEDFVELIAFYVTESKEEYQKRVDKGLIEVPASEKDKKNVIEIDGKYYSTEMVDKINQKMGIVKDYLMEEWNLDIDKLRDIVQRRIVDVQKADLTKI